MDVNHKHEIGQSVKGGFGAAFGSVFGKFFGCLGVLVLLIIVAALFSGGENKSTAKDASKEGAPVVEVSASELSKSFQSNEAKAKLAYDDKLLKVTGSVKEIDLDITDNPVVRLRGSGDVQGMGINSNGKMTDVAINGLSKEVAADVNKGQKLVVTCTSIDEVLGAPQLSGCSIAK